MEEIKIEEIIDFNKQDKKLEFKENIETKIQNLLLIFHYFNIFY